MQARKWTLPGRLSESNVSAAYNYYQQAADTSWPDRPVVLTDSVAAKAGLTKDHARIKDENGGGYTVFVEGLHQLHCLVGHHLEARV